MRTQTARLREDLDGFPAGSPVFVLGWSGDRCDAVLVPLDDDVEPRRVHELDAALVERVEPITYDVRPDLRPGARIRAHGSECLILHRSANDFGEEGLLVLALRGGAADFPGIDDDVYYPVALGAAGPAW